MPTGRPQMRGGGLAALLPTNLMHPIASLMMTIARDTQITFRLPSDLRADLQRLADHDQRSISSFMVRVLNGSWRSRATLSRARRNQNIVLRQ
jgi:hypothetical protein